jgi:hypothetical protein
VGLATGYYFLSECCCLKFCGPYGAPSLTRGRVCNLWCNHSMFRVAQNPKPYFTVSSDAPPTWRPGSRIYIPQEQGGPVIPPDTALVGAFLLTALFVVVLDPRENQLEGQAIVCVSTSAIVGYPVTRHYAEPSVGC